MLLSFVVKPVVVRQRKSHNFCMRPVTLPLTAVSAQGISLCPNITQCFVAPFVYFCFCCCFSLLFLDYPGLIGITEPRRVAAMSMANRLAVELNLEFGRYVGYQVRKKTNRGRRGREGGREREREEKMRVRLAGIQ